MNAQHIQRTFKSNDRQKDAIARHEFRLKAEVELDDRKLPWSKRIYLATQLRSNNFVYEPT